MSGADRVELRIPLAQKEFFPDAEELWTIMGDNDRDICENII